MLPPLGRHCHKLLSVLTVIQFAERFIYELLSVAQALFISLRIVYYISKLLILFSLLSIFSTEKDKYASELSWVLDIHIPVICILFYFLLVSIVV